MYSILTAVTGYSNQLLTLNKEDLHSTAPDIFDTFHFRLRGHDNYTGQHGHFYKLRTPITLLAA